MKNKIAKKIGLTALTGFAADIAIASGTAMPWDGPLSTLASNLTGPLATTVSIFAMAAAGFSMYFGGDEMSATIKKLLQIVFIVAAVANLPRLLQILGITGSGSLIF